MYWDRQRQRVGTHRATTGSMLLHKATHLIHLVLTASSPACFSPIATIYLVLATSSPVCFWYPLPVTVETSPCCRCFLTCFCRTAVAGGRSGRLVLAASSPICSSPTATVYGDRSVDLVLATAPPVCFWQPLPVIVVLILFSLPHGLFVYDSRCQWLWCWSCSRYGLLVSTRPVCFWQPLPVIVMLILFSLLHCLFVSDSRCQWLWCWSCSRYHPACLFLTAVASDCDVDLILATSSFFSKFFSLLTHLFSLPRHFFLNVFPFSPTATVACDRDVRLVLALPGRYAHDGRSGLQPSLHLRFLRRRLGRLLPLQVYQGQVSLLRWEHYMAWEIIGYPVKLRRRRRKLLLLILLQLYY